MTDSFGALPAAAKSIEPFAVSVSDSDISGLKILLKHSKVAPPSYESSQEDRRYGVTASWLANAKDIWLNNFDWRESERRVNSFPNFSSCIVDNSDTFNIHFVALFSENPNAIPLLCLHGWPGSFLEFLPLMSNVKSEYNSSNLPYHVIVPSLPGYTFSSGPPAHRNLCTADASRIIDKLMSNLGFEAGYLVTGGDIGSRIARILAAKYDSCKGIHINFCSLRSPPANLQNSLNEPDRQLVERGRKFLTTGAAYAMEHGTRTSTIGLILSSSPLALLAWIGEKFLEWTDEDPSLDTILEAVSLYWYTSTISRCLYPYRERFEGKGDVHDNPELRIKGKPFGYSLFPKELLPSPKAWVETTGDLAFFREHSKGGHFAAMERPKEMLEDLEAFMELVRAKGLFERTI